MKLLMTSTAGRPGPAAILIVSSAVAVAMLAVRVVYSGRLRFASLPWDLVLAWLPLALATAAVRVRPTTRRRAMFALSLGALWLLFFPNAPYLCTEFIHLSRHDMFGRAVPTWALSYTLQRPVPHWFDVLMLVAFAWNGLMLGFLSLHMIQTAIRARYGTRWAWTAALLAVWLGAFGVSIGRFQRWNSWDLFTAPGQLLMDVAGRLLLPWQHPRTAVSTLMLSVFLSLAYLTLCAMSRGEDDRVTR